MEFPPITPATIEGGYHNGSESDGKGGSSRVLRVYRAVAAELLLTTSPHSTRCTLVEKHHKSDASLEPAAPIGLHGPVPTWILLRTRTGATLILTPIAVLHPNLPLDSYYSCLEACVHTDDTHWKPQARPPHNRYESIYKCASEDLRSLPINLAQFAECAPGAPRASAFQSLSSTKMVSTSSSSTCCRLLRPCWYPTPSEGATAPAPPCPPRATTSSSPAATGMSP